MTMAAGITFPLFWPGQVEARCPRSPDRRLGKPSTARARSEYKNEIQESTMPKLIVSIDGVVIKEVTLAKDRTTLGRRPYNDIVVDNLAISGEHAVLHMIGGDVYLEDLNSTNGTYVNGRAIKKQALEQNDIIEVGKYKIRFLAGATAATESLLPVRSAPPASSGP